MLGAKVYYKTTRSGFIKAKIVAVAREENTITIKVTSKHHNAWPYRTGECIETRQEFLSYR